MTYGTTPVFLEYFGLRSLEELPAADELRRIPVTKPEALVDRRSRPGHRAAGPTRNCRKPGSQPAAGNRPREQSPRA